MQVKRITAPNMRQALQIVREQLGPDAIILSNRRVPNGIELICSMEAPELVASGPLMASEMKAAGEKRLAAASREQTPLEKGLSEWEQEGRNKAKAIELSLRQKLADKSRTEKSRPHSAADFYEQRAASLESTQRGLTTSTVSDLPDVAYTSASERLASSNKPTPSNKQLPSNKPSQSTADTHAIKNHSVAQNSAAQNIAAKAAPAPAGPVGKPTTAMSAPVNLQKFANPSAPPQASASAPTIREAAASTPNAGGKNRPTEELDSLRDELQSLRSMLQGQFQHMAWMNLTQQEPARADVWKRLTKLGFSGDCIRLLLDEADAPTASRLWHEVLKQLLGKLPVAGDDVVMSGGVFAFVGPTGAGKTTTIGKLAARAVLKHGADNVVLITTDTYRVAGHEQLRVFGRILGVQVVVVDQIEQLPAVIERYSKRHLVMVDTAGLSAKDDRLHKQLSLLAALKSHIKTFLVMPCSMQQQTQVRAFELYSAAALGGMILTKLDEAATLGETLSLVMKQGLPVCYVADGQQVPQDVHVATAREIVQRAMLSRSAQPQDEAELAEAYWQSTQLPSERGVATASQVA